MCALIEWISQDVTDSGSAPEIIVGVKLRVGFDMGDWDLQQVPPNQKGQ